MTICDMCDNGDGESCYPYYGVAPHVGSPPQILDKEDWPPNFAEDPESPGEGIYTHCMNCGEGTVRSSPKMPVYRLLQKDELILDTDEMYFDDKKAWGASTNTAGHRAPDPKYTSHRQYRRRVLTHAESPKGVQLRAGRWRSSDHVLYWSGFSGKLSKSELYQEAVAIITDLEENHPLEFLFRSSL